MKAWLASGLILAAMACVDSTSDAKVIASFVGDENVTTVATHGLPRSYAPVAVAIDRKLGLIVADPGGQRIWSIDKAGTARVIAGVPSGNGLETSEPGAYHDGSALSARFDRPSGIAVTKDGTIYVADRGNDCIRKIAGGVVSTFAGVPHKSGKLDGVSGSSLFVDPRGLAIQADGTLYVADGAGGLRKIAHGLVTSLPITDRLSVDVHDVSLYEGNHDFLFYTTPAGFGRFNLTDDQTEDQVTHLSGCDGVVALAESRALFSCSDRHSIYFSDTGSVRRIVAGDASQDSGRPGAFRDGDARDARFDRPHGMALGDDGHVIVADTGNRALRRLPRIDLRWMTSSDITSGASAGAKYHVVYISNSVAFHDAMWQDSIEGLTESYLNSHAASLRLPKPVIVDAIRFGGAGLKAQSDFIREVLGIGSVDLVVWAVDSHTFRDDYTDYLDTLPSITPEHVASWRSTIDATVSELQANGTKLVLIDQPFGTQIGPGEGYALREIHFIEAKPELRETTRQANYGYDFMTGLETALSTTHADFIPTYARFLAYERGPHLPLSISEDFHFNPAGNAFVANILIEKLEADKPWLHK